MGNRLNRFVFPAMAGLLAWSAATGLARAEVDEVRLSTQPSLGHLPMMVMQQKQLVEKHLKAAGLTDTKVKWVQLGGASAVNDALLSRSIDFTSGGIAGLAKLWAATKGKVRAIGASCSMPMYLNTRNPEVKTLKDFSSADKIALPAVGVSIQAIVLQMAAEKAFGDPTKLDSLTVTMKHPDAFIALMTGSGGVNSHLGYPPYQEEELKNPKNHRVLDSYDVLGGPTTGVIVAAMQEFHDENPKTYKAVADALKEAIDFINHDRKGAAQVWLDVVKGKRESLNDIVKIFENPKVRFTLVPHNSMQFVDFMYKVGQLKVKPKSWKELYFPNVHHLKGAS
jgi:NitT/TauT family transport system substrate-binding protein